MTKHWCMIWEPWPSVHAACIYLLAVLVSDPRCMRHLIMDCYWVHLNLDFPGGAVLKNLPAKSGDARDTVSIPGL